MKQRAILVAALALVSVAHAAGFVSRSYEFKANKPLQVGLDLGVSHVDTDHGVALRVEHGPHGTAHASGRSRHDDGPHG